MIEYVITDNEFEKLSLMELPTFYKGQRVRIHNRPVEWACPKCGRELNSGRLQKESYLGVVVETDVESYCDKCFHDGPLEGWHGIDIEDVGCYAVPYPLIEAIKEEPC